MVISEETLKANYGRLSDDKLLRIAAEDAGRLRPEALVLLRAELDSRGLAESAASMISASLKVFSPAELDAYSALLRAQPCPVCHSSARPLNATVTSKVLSFVVMTTWKKRLVIACPNCLDKLNQDAATYSALLGWWGFPWGIVRTIQALISNSKMARNNHAAGANDLLKAFVAANAPRIEIARAQPHDLQVLVKATHLSA